ncbi:lysozyme inhibitor LprI family protein [Catenovulum sediminis]|uniref:Lysozyme inhibitor LprI family protein n=1 Tax=Catenovulum sediminis TaxID=1740262 RepID=A0ABV1RBQ2_9ALTE|nr:lysozyme inhibitor LprI family protein [Catenovulum sediminis]
MTNKSLTVTVFIFSLLTSLNVYSAPSAREKADALIENCKQNSKTTSSYAICLDESAKQVDRELQAWVFDAEEKLQAQMGKNGNESILSEYRRANKHYEKFIESQCRSVFFQNLTSSDAANEFRICKIKKTLQRIHQLKEDSID